LLLPLCESNAPTPLQSNQLDETDALDEEVEAIRIQKKQTEKLADDDFLFGGPTLAAVVKSGNKGKTTVGAAATAAAAAADKPQAAVEQIQRKTDRMSKADMLQMVATGA
jgi:hypothetical protein